MRAAAAVLAFLGLAACGGGSGGAPPPAAQPLGSLVPRWMAIAGGLGGRAQVTDADASSAGRVYVAGILQGSAVFGRGEANETTLPGGAPDYHGFLAAYAGDGSVDWAREIVGRVSVVVVSARPDGVVHVAGNFYGSVTLASGEPEETTLVSSSVTGLAWLFLACYEADGTLRWARAAGDRRDTTIPSGIAASGSSCVVVGNFDGSPVFGAGEPSETTLDSVDGLYDGFAARYAADDGTFLGATRIGGPGNDLLRSVCPAPSGFLVAGDRPAPSGQDAFVARVHESGALEDVATVGGAGSQAASHVRARPDGSFVFLGWFEAEAAPGGAPLTPPGPAGTGGYFLAGYDPLGGLLWARAIGSRGHGIALGEGFTELAMLPDGRFAVGASLKDELFLDEDHVVEGSADTASWPDTAVVVLDADGTPEAALRASGDATERFYALTAFPDDGALAVAGYSTSTRVTLGEGAEAVSHDLAPQTADSVIVRLRPE